MQTLVFDIETALFSEAFRKAKTRLERMAQAPTMRVACVYCVEEGTYQYFTDNQVDDLIQTLAAADHLISYNGKRFDLLVLARHYGLNLDEFDQHPHTDMLEIIHDAVGYWVSLNDMVKHNFNERKHVQGRAMADLDLEALKDACRSDVDQTTKLWQLSQTGELKYPPQRQRGRIDDEFEIEEGGPGQFAPTECPLCGDVASLEFIELEPDELDDLTEGQMADYCAGWWGSLWCLTCNNVIDYG